MLGAAPGAGVAVPSGTGDDPRMSGKKKSKEMRGDGKFQGKVGTKGDHMHEVLMRNERDGTGV